MQLGSRKLKILQAIIDDYIISAEPVGSRTISKKYGIGISSATIRNEMADLEEMGYLEQPHTSAGRIPSDKAYRLYVDHLMKVNTLSETEAQTIKQMYEQKILQVEQIIISASKVISSLTNYTAMVLAPKTNRIIIRHIQLVPVDSQFALLVVVTSSGIIKDTLIRIPAGIDGDYLIRISNMLTEYLKDMSFSDIDHDFIAKMEHSFNQERDLFNSLVDALTESFAVQEQKDIYLGGTSNIFNFPEYHDILRAKAFMSLMEEKDLLYSLMDKQDEEGVSISIGTENEFQEVKNCSIVTATYKIGSRVMGTLGIIGPTRMKYSKAVSVLDYMGKSLSNYLTKLYGE